MADQPVLPADGVRGTSQPRCFLIRDRVIDPGTGMVGTVANYWFDDQGQWLDIIWDDSTMLASEVVPVEECRYPKPCPDHAQTDGPGPISEDDAP